MIESTEKKLTLEEFFKQQFRNKVYLIFRSFFMAGILLVFTEKRFTHEKEQCDLTLHRLIA